MAWIDLGSVPSVIDWISLAGVGVSIWAAMSARSKSKAVQESIADRTKQIATAHLRESLDSLKRLTASLDQAVGDDDTKGARYVLVWIAQDSGRCLALLPKTEIPDISRADSADTLTELLERISNAASDAKSRLFSNNQKSKLTTITKTLKTDLDALALDLVTITTHIGYGMEVNNVHRR